MRQKQQKQKKYLRGQLLLSVCRVLLADIRKQQILVKVSRRILRRAFAHETWRLKSKMNGSQTPSTNVCQLPPICLSRWSEKRFAGRDQARLVDSTKANEKVIDSSFATLEQSKTKTGSAELLGGGPRANESKHRRGRSSALQHVHKLLIAESVLLPSGGEVKSHLVRLPCVLC